MAAPKYNPDFRDCSERYHDLPILLLVRTSQTGEDGFHVKSLYHHDVLQLCLSICFPF